MIYGKEAVIECYKQFFDALINKDAERLDILLSDNFAHVHMTGIKIFKNQYIHGIISGLKDYRSAVHDNIKADVINSFAVVTGRTRTEVAVYGGDFHEVDLERTIKMSMKEGRWCIDEVDVMPCV